MLDRPVTLRNRGISLLSCVRDSDLLKHAFPERVSAYRWCLPLDLSIIPSNVKAIREENCEGEPSWNEV
jgi:hypothetical protein